MYLISFLQMVTSQSYDLEIEKREVCFYAHFLLWPFQAFFLYGNPWFVKEAFALQQELVKSVTDIRKNFDTNEYPKIFVIPINSVF